MDQWEHMRIEAVQKGIHTVELRTVSGPHYNVSELDVEQEPGDQGLRLLDEFGKAGWELVTAESAPTGSAMKNTFWLKRPVESQGGWAYTP